jgi:4-carboxymuconolactone decarboxylase
MSTDRLPPIPPAAWTEEQRREAQAIINGPRGALVSPFVPLMRSPELMGHAQRMGEYLRYRSTLPLRLSELAILITARCWSQQVEWAIHAPIAQKAGVAASTVEAIAQGRQPPDLAEDEAALYAFCSELHQHRGVSDPTWARALDLFGEQGVVDLIGINGYYTLLSMVMNASRTPAPPSVVAPLPHLSA